MSNVARPLPVALIGLGGVGRSILAQLLSSPLSSRFTLILIANSRQSLSLPLPASPLTPTNCLPILEKYGKPLDVPSIISVLSNHPDAPGIFIDSTASELIPGVYAQILRMGVHLVTPNKKAFSGAEAMYLGIQEASYPNSSALVYGESTVGAGLPILSTVRDLVGTGDEIEKIEGIFSGTLSYIFNQFSTISGGDVKFSDIVKDAKERGYTEPDPRDDLSGTDVARKLTILSRLVPSSPRLTEGFASVPTQSLVPDVLADVSTKEEFMDRLSEGDAYFDGLREEAKKEGMVVRYVGVLDVKARTVEAKLEKYPFDHPFAVSLKGSENMVSFYTTRYGERPLIVQGPGAGGDLTAMGVTSDMIKVHERLTTRRA